MISMITVSGRLTKDAEFKDSKSGGFTAFGLAVNTSTKDSEGNYIPNFYDVTVWGAYGKALLPRLTKGTQVTVVGDYAYVPYTAKDGSTRDAHRIRANAVDAPFSRAEGGQQASKPAAPKAAVVDEAEDDLPF